MSRTVIRVCVTASLVVLIVTATACVSVRESKNSKTAPPPPSANAILDSLPGMAEVYIDGEFRGTAPVSLKLEEGSHQIEFRLMGYQSWTRDLVVVAGDDTNVVVTLERE